jgi:hypothetical protein
MNEIPEAIANGDIGGKPRWFADSRVLGATSLVALATTIILSASGLSGIPQVVAVIATMASFAYTLLLMIFVSPSNVHVNGTPVDWRKFQHWRRVLRWRF